MLFSQGLILLSLVVFVNLLWAQLSVIIGKYLSSLRKLDHIIAPKAGFEAQL